MKKYVTHHFAHAETLGRAERWLVQRGFDPADIEVHRGDIFRLSARVSPERVAEVEMIFNAAELHDPDGWPSFWELAQVPHPHVDHVVTETTATAMISAKPSPVTWRRSEVVDTNDTSKGFLERWDVPTRFG